MHHQVRFALDRFAPEVKARKLAVMGAVHDFRNDDGQGHGRLVFVNVNGESDSAKVKQLIGELRR